jgi:hypothetical protein
MHPLPQYVREKWTAAESKKLFALQKKFDDTGKVWEKAMAASVALQKKGVPSEKVAAAIQEDIRRGRIAFQAAEHLHTYKNLLKKKYRT